MITRTLPRRAACARDTMFTEEGAQKLLHFVMRNKVGGAGVVELPVLKEREEKQGFLRAIADCKETAAGAVQAAEAAWDEGEAARLEDARTVRDEALLENQARLSTAEFFPSGAEEEQQQRRAAAMKQVTMRERTVEQRFARDWAVASEKEDRVRLARGHLKEAEEAEDLATLYVAAGAAAQRPAEVAATPGAGTPGSAGFPGGTGGQFSGAGFKSWVGMASGDAYVQGTDGGFVPIGSAGVRMPGTDFKSGALEALRGQARQGSSMAGGSEESPARKAARAVAGAMAKHQEGAAAEDVVKSLYGTFKDFGADVEARHKRDAERALWAQGERLLGYVLDIEGRRSGFFREEVDDLMGSKQDETVKSLLAHGMATKSMRNFSTTIEKLEEHVRKQAETASDPTEMAYLFKECIGVVEELHNMESAYLNILHMSQSGTGARKTSAAAFTQVLEDRKRALQVKAGLKRARHFDVEHSALLLDLAGGSASTRAQRAMAQLQEPAGVGGGADGGQPAARPVAPPPPAGPGPQPPGSGGGRPRREPGNGDGAFHLPGRFHQQALRENWEGVDLRRPDGGGDPTFLVTSQGKCWKCAGRLDPPGHRVENCPRQ